MEKRKWEFKTPEKTGLKTKNMLKVTKTYGTFLKRAREQSQPEINEKEVIQQRMAENAQFAKSMYTKTVFGKPKLTILQDSKEKEPSQRICFEQVDNQSILHCIKELLDDDKYDAWIYNNATNIILEYLTQKSNFEGLIGLLKEIRLFCNTEANQIDIKNMNKEHISVIQEALKSVFKLN